MSQPNACNGQKDSPLPLLIPPHPSHLTLPGMTSPLNTVFPGYPFPYISMDSNNKVQIDRDELHPVSDHPRGNQASTKKLSIGIILAIFVPLLIFVYTAKEVVVSDPFETFYRQQYSLTMTSNANCFKGNDLCLNLLRTLGPSLLMRYHDNYVTFKEVCSYLLYFGLVPLMLHIILVMVLDLCHKNKMRLTSSLLIIH